MESENRVSLDDGVPTGQPDERAPRDAVCGAADERHVPALSHYPADGYALADDPAMAGKGDYDHARQLVGGRSEPLLVTQHKRPVDSDLGATQTVSLYRECRRLSAKRGDDSRQDGGKDGEGDDHAGQAGGVLWEGGGGQR